MSHITKGETPTFNRHLYIETSFNSALHYFKIPIHLDSRDPSKHESMKPNIYVEFEVEDLSKVSQKDIIALIKFKEDNSLKPLTHVNAPFFGIVNLNVENSSEIEYSTQIATMNVQLDLANLEDVRKAFQLSQLTVAISVKGDNAVVNFFRQYFRVDIFPGFEDFEKIMDKWSEFCSTNDVPVEYLTYEYFLNVCAPLIIDFSKSYDPKYLAEDNVRPVSEFCFIDAEKERIFYSKMPTTTL